MFTGMVTFCTIIPSGREIISRQSEQYQYSYPQLQHTSSQGMAEVDVKVKRLLFIAEHQLKKSVYCEGEPCLYYHFQL